MVCISVSLASCSSILSPILQAITLRENKARIAQR